MFNSDELSLIYQQGPKILQDFPLNAALKCAILTDDSEKLRTIFTDEICKKYGVSYWRLSCELFAAIYNLLPDYILACHKRLLRKFYHQQSTAQPISPITRRARELTIQRLSRFVKLGKVRVSLDEHAIPTLNYTSHSGRGWYNGSNPIDLQVTLNSHTFPRVSKNTIRIGPWQYRKPTPALRFEVRYVGPKDKTAAQIWQQVTNQELKRAIFAACGESIVDTLQPILIKEDKRGKLYDIHTGVTGAEGTDLQRFVRVVCPTTGAAYWLACRADCPTPTQAIAESFHLRADEYSPQIER